MVPILVLISYILYILSAKAVSKALKSAGSTNSAVIDIADNYGYIGHSAAGFLTAYLLAPYPVASALVLAALFAFYEVMHYVYPDSRAAIIEFLAAYSAYIAISHGLMHG